MNNDKPIAPDNDMPTPAVDKKGQAESSQTPDVATKPEEKAAKPSSMGSAKPSAKSSSKSSGGKGWLFILILLLVAGGVSAWWWFYGQHLQPKNEMVSPQVELQDDLAQLKQALSAETDARMALTAEVKKNNVEQQLALNAQAERLRELSGSSRTDWVLAEAEYLMHLANQRLLTERDSGNALALLESADEILRKLNEVQLIPVREALAKNIVALKSQPLVDREGLFLQLKALSEQVIKLPILPPKMSVADQEKPLPVLSDETEAVWYSPVVRVGRIVLNEAEKLILVRHRSDPVDPLLTPEQEQLLRLQLGAVLEESQLALLREEQQIYEAGLSKARELLSTYFEVNDQQAESLVEQLRVLEGQQIIQARPDISEGLNALRDYIDSWHNRRQVERDGGEG
ncbi:uroporphyrinogen-III C-methyltransferase [Porticoccus sp.]